MPPKQRYNWRSLLPGVWLVFLVFAAYFPALRGEFLWDDDANIIKSLPLRSLDGLRRIWFEPRATQQYYPVTHTSFWLDYHLWGLHPTAYHVENILLHGCSAFLLWLILRRLQVRAAWFGAALFALHPVVVESVAWITERKNTLSGVFFMASLLAAMKYWLPDKPPAGNRSATPPLKFYWLALGFYLCGLWSKTAIVGLPGVILLLLWWKRRGPTRRDIMLLAPFAALGLVFSGVTIWIEKTSLGAGGDEWGFSAVQRCLIASRAFWFYLGKLLWPHPLMFMYPRWTIAGSNLLAWVPLVAVVALFVVLWRRREGWARPVLMALGFFVALLFPVLGFFNVVFYHYSFVNDHFQYLACIGPLALAAAGIARAFDFWEKERAVYQPVVCGVLLLVLATLTWRQAHVYQKLDGFWREALARNPDSWMAHDNLGHWFSSHGQFEEAAGHYHDALRLHPDDYFAHNNLGFDLARQNKLDDAIREYNESLAIYPGYVLARYNLGSALATGGRFDEAIEQYNRVLALDPDFVPARQTLGNALTMKGRLDEAIEQYTKLLALDPGFAPAHANRGRALAAQGKTDEAMADYRRALELEPDSVDALANLGNALFAKGNLDDAISCYHKALAIKNDAPVIHYNLGVALVRQGKRVEARQEFVAVLRLKPTDPNALRQLKALSPDGSVGQLN